MTEFFIDQGHTVLGCARNNAEITALADRYPAPHCFHAVDVCDDLAVQHWAEALLAEGPAPDLLLNNAAIVNPPATLWETTADDFSQVIDVNIKGVFHVIRHFTPAMIDRGEGLIVNFSSGWGRSVSPEVAPYCATKWAIEGLTQALASELPQGMAAIPLNPGIIHTEMLAKCWGDGAASFPTPDEWIKTAGPFLLKLKASDNGRSLSV